jgi:hypothetical protein
MMPTLTGMDVPEKLLALVSRYALQSDAVGATPVQVTIFDAVSRGLAYYPFGLRLILGKPAADEEGLELEDLMHPLLPSQCQKNTVTPKVARNPEPAPWSGGGGKAGGRSDPAIDGEADGLKRRSSKMPAGYARR